MKKQISLFFLFLLSIAVVPSKAQEVLQLSLEPDKTTKRDVRFSSADPNASPIDAELLLNYDINTKELTLCVSPKSGSFDRVFIPTKAYGRESLRNAVRREMNGKFKMSRPFKQSIAFGIGPSVAADGANQKDYGNMGLPQEMFKVGDSFVVHYVVTNPDKALRIILRGITAVNTLETASGKIKYRFMSVASDFTIEVKVPNDPCKIRENADIVAEAKSLYDQIMTSHKELTKLAGMREKSKCEECKKQFMTEYPQRLRELKKRYEAVAAKCPTVDIYLNEIEIPLSDADSIKCQPKVFKDTSRILPTPCNGIEKSLKDGVNKMERNINRIIAGIDASTAKTECETLIIELDEKISLMDAKCKNKAEVKKLISSYDNLKTSYQSKVR